MEQSQNWRQMFERGERPRSPASEDTLGHGGPRPLSGYDDAFQRPVDRQDGGHGDASADRASPLSPSDITDEAAMALAQDTDEYRPWILQRGRARPALMLHLRRRDPKSGLWMGWELSYPHLVAVEYTGDQLLSLDFGSRQFMLEGAGLDELARHLQTGNVVMVQEYAAGVWSGLAGRQRVTVIRRLLAP